MHQIYNRGIALLMIIALLPLFLVITAALLLTQGTEIVYRGPRIGRNGRIFHIYKFRTLDTAAARRITQDRTLPSNSGIETPMGRVLRANRLDELPQLFNILLGDMNLCGPRPVRPEIAAIERGRIANYDLRFSVKPGLVGPTQAYISHGTSKRIRARFNNLLCRRPVSYVAEVRLMAAVAQAMLAKVLADIAGRLGIGLGAAPEATAETASGGVGVAVALMRDMRLSVARSNLALRVVRLGSRTMQVLGPLPIGDQREAVLSIHLRGGGVRKARVLLSEAEKPGVVGYTAVSERDEFVVERYGLGLAVVPPALQVARVVAARGRPAQVAASAPAPLAAALEPLMPRVGT